MRKQSENDLGLKNSAFHYHLLNWSHELSLDVCICLFLTCNIRSETLFLSDLWHANPSAIDLYLPPRPGDPHSVSQQTAGFAVPQGLPIRKNL